jgi:hypothetical protein
MINESRQTDEIIEILELENRNDILQMVKDNLKNERNVFSGKEGYVIVCGDEIVKVFYDAFDMTAIGRLISAQKRNKKFKVLPTITDSGNYFIVRDNYKPYTKKCKELMETLFGEDGDIYDFDDGCLYERYVFDNEQPSNRKEQDAIDWYEQAIEELAMIGIDDIGDLTKHNIAEDKRGNIIYHDFVG